MKRNAGRVTPHDDALGASLFLYNEFDPFHFRNQRLSAFVAHQRGAVFEETVTSAFGLGVEVMHIMLAFMVGVATGVMLTMAAMAYAAARGNQDEYSDTG
jgi:hypothetical protein